MTSHEPIHSRKFQSLPVVSLKEKSVNQSCCAHSVVETRCTSKKNLSSYVTGSVQTPVCPVPRITHLWIRKDHVNQIRCRISSFRIKYRVEPGLYAIGEPCAESDVLVTANYKLTFDVLRKELEGINLWILVLDTKGINVWCAAGKGTFGTAELVSRIKSSCLKSIVSHNRIILPQLGAPGVSAGDVKKQTGFNVKYGPVRARDIKKYIADRYTATREMRTVSFMFTERAVLVPMEFFPAIKKSLPAALMILFVAGLYPHGILFMDSLWNGLPLLIAEFFAILAGACLAPLLLPLIPGRSFALKGLIVGLVAACAVLYLFPDMMRSIFLVVACLSGVPAIASYLALQFTGSTPFTNMTGVKKEVRLSLPFQIGGAAVAAIAIFAWKLSAWGIL